MTLLRMSKQRSKTKKVMETVFATFYKSISSPSVLEEGKFTNFGNLYKFNENATIIIFS